MDNAKDYQIKQFITKDKKIPEKIDNTFDNFINKVRNNEVITKQEEIYQNKETTSKLTSRFYMLKKLTAVAACLLIVVVASNAYARTQGYDNIFFMIKDLAMPKVENKNILKDKDIVISYKYFNITDNAEMQINELQVKDNKAKLFLLVKEQKDNAETPLYYKVYDEKNTILFDGKSQRRDGKKTYTEALELSNYKEDINNVKLEIYSKDKILLKTVVIDLNGKTIEARTENAEVKTISLIDLKKFIKDETEKNYTKEELKDKQIIVLEVYDIYYNQGKYVAKYLFMMPSEEEFENDKVEETTIYENSIEFTVENEKFRLIELGKQEEL